MKTITLYILPSDSQCDYIGCVQSFGTELISKFVYLNHRALDKVICKCETDWFMYVFGNETITTGLKEALPTFLEENAWEAFILMQKVGDKFYQSPRIFKKAVELNGFLPKHKVNSIRILNGWLLG